MKRTGTSLPASAPGAAVPATRAAREAEAAQAADRATAAALPVAREPMPAASAPPRSTAPASLRQRIDAAAGRPLPAATRREMEQRLGHDFSRVRVVTDAEAGGLAQGLAARALTYGERIAFAPGEFAPGTSSGRRLLAHELAHVVQQRALGRAELALQAGAKEDLLDQAKEVATELAEAGEDKETRKPVVAKARALATKLAAQLALAKGESPPEGTMSADDARQGLGIVGTALVAKEPDDATAVAVESKDAAVQTRIVNDLASGARGVAGQQALVGRLAKIAGTQVGAVGKQTSTQWLEANTEAIGKTFAKLEEKGLTGLKRSIALERSQALLEQYFKPAARDDIKPDPLGKIGAQKVDEDSKRIIADCDVYATYAARLLRAQGWTTAGYLAVFPKDIDAHAVSLSSRPDPADDTKVQYLGTSNAELRELGTFADAKAALPDLLKLALEIYTTAPTAYAAYYLQALKGGALDLQLLDPVNNNLTPFRKVP